MKKSLLILTLAASSTFAWADFPADYTGTPYKNHICPGIIEAEDFDNGGSGVAFSWSNLQGYNPNYYRTDQVSMEAGGSGTVLSFCSDGDYTCYTFTCATEGDYDLTVLHCAGDGSGQFDIAIDGEKITNTPIKVTGEKGNWGSYNESTETVHLTAGKHLLKWFSYGNVNIDKFIFSIPLDVDYTAVTVSKDVRLADAIKDITDVTSLSIQGYFAQEDIPTLHSLKVVNLDLSKLKYITKEGNPAEDESIRYYSANGDWQCIQNEILLPAALCENMTTLKKVILPVTSTEFQRFVFNGCTSLKEVVGLDQITKFQAGCMQGTDIRELTLNPSCTVIEWTSFKGCKNLTKLNGLAESQIISIQSEAFAGTDIQGELVFPATCTEIGNWSFGTGDWGVTHYGITKVDCSRITGECKIASCAFAKEGGIKEAILPKKGYFEGGSIFNSATALEKIVMPEANDKYTALYDNTVSGASNLKEITIASSVTKLQHHAFDNCKINKITVQGAVAPEFEGDDNNTDPASVFGVEDVNSTVIEFEGDADNFTAAATYGASDIFGRFLMAQVSEMNGVSGITKEQKYCNVNMEITVNEGWNILLLPFDAQAQTIITSLETEELGTLKSFDGENVEINSLDGENVIAAYTPIFVKVAAETETTLFNTVNLKKGTTAGETIVAGYKATGTLEGEDVEEVYLADGDTFATTDFTTVDAFHGWIATDGTLGVNTITVKGNGETKIYNLNGMKLSAPCKGINIINGKKVIAQK